MCDTNPLNYDYGRFAKDEIPNENVRRPLNHVYARLNGISAISTILRANEVERQAQEDGLTLTNPLQNGLFDALVELADGAVDQATELGEYLFKRTKEASNGQ